MYLLDETKCPSPCGWRMELLMQETQDSSDLIDSQRPVASSLAVKAGSKLANLMAEQDMLRCSTHELHHPNPESVVNRNVSGTLMLNLLRASNSLTFMHLSKRNDYM
jgi:hypothetical protein